MSDPTAAGEQIPDAVSSAVNVAGWPGTVLPRLQVSGFSVFPVVVVDDRIWAHRVQLAAQPELDMSTLAVWEGWMPELGTVPPRSAVTIVGFVCDGVSLGQGAGSPACPLIVVLRLAERLGCWSVVFPFGAPVAFFVLFVVVVFT